MARTPRTIITDFRHLPEVSPGELVAGRSLPAFLAAIVSAASLQAAHSKVRLPLRCRCRPGHRACPGNIIISRHVAYLDVEWQCSECDFNGVITHWKDSDWDLGAPSRAKLDGPAPASDPTGRAAPKPTLARGQVALAGRWRIVEMEAWDVDDIELAGPAFIEFADEGGALRFIAVEGELDCRFSEVGGRPSVEFSWMGADEGDAACGRGAAHLQADGSLAGRIFIHNGDDSAFMAKRSDPSKAPDSRSRRRLH